MNAIRLSARFDTDADGLLTNGKITIETEASGKNFLDVKENYDFIKKTVETFRKGAKKI